jgi:alkylation response protein AidB-like acyl-CoA dehydrogenase
MATRLAAGAAARAQEIADRILAPAAEEVDLAGRVPRAHLDALAEAGLFGLFGPEEAGGLDADETTSRLVYEALAGGCGSTFFLWMQGHSLVRMLTRIEDAPPRARYLPDLCSGALRAGIINYLRRPGPPSIVACHVDGGLAVSGRAPWVTGWGTLDLYLMGAGVEASDDVAFFCFPGEEVPGVHPHEPAEVVAMQAAVNVPVDLVDVFVPSEEIVQVLPRESWRRRDSARTAQPTSAVFGVTMRAVGLLAEVGRRTGDEGIAATAAALAAELNDCRERSYEAADAFDAGEDVDLDELRALRAWSFDLAQRTTYAFVIASGGRAMERTHPAQRLYREASFYAVQSQGPDVKQVTLKLLVEARPQ